MSIRKYAEKMVQITGWEDGNQNIPEEQITEIVKSALSMQSGQYPNFSTESGFYGAKPFKIWIPHRECELENVLSLAGIHSLPQASNQVFHNVKNVLVYLVHEPKHIMEKNEIAQIKSSQDKKHLSWLCCQEDAQMNWKIKKDWDGYNRLIEELLSIEKDKKQKRQYREMPQPIVPYHEFDGEHLHGIYSTLGMAIGSANLQAYELGYYTQFHTAYRATVAWREFYGNKFHPEGKWYPHLIQIIGTHPQAGKSNPNRSMASDSATDTSTCLDPNDVESFVKNKTSPELTNNFKVMDISQHRSYIYKKLSKMTVPFYQKKFFHRHYGQYSPYPRALFNQCYFQKAKID